MCLNPSCVALFAGDGSESGEVLKRRDDSLYVSDYGRLLLVMETPMGFEPPLESLPPSASACPDEKRPLVRDTFTLDQAPLRSRR